MWVNSSLCGFRGDIGGCYADMHGKALSQPDGMCLLMAGEGEKRRGLLCNFYFSSSFSGRTGWMRVGRWGGQFSEGFTFSQQLIKKNSFVLRNFSQLSLGAHRKTGKMYA